MSELIVGHVVFEMGSHVVFTTTLLSKRSFQVNVAQEMSINQREMCYAGRSCEILPAMFGGNVPSSGGMSQGMVRV